MTPETSNVIPFRSAAQQPPPCCRCNRDCVFYDVEPGGVKVWVCPDAACNASAGLCPWCGLPGAIGKGYCTDMSCGWHDGATEPDGLVDLDEDNPF
jgi:hypothetical protein